MTTVELLTNLVKKEAKAKEVQKQMRKDYERLVEEKKVEEILYDRLGTG